MVVDRRRELLDAGVRLALDQRLQDLLSGVDTRTVATSAGVSPGSFFHHFRNRAGFAIAVADWFGELWDQRVDHLVRATRDAVADSGNATRATANVEWDALMAQTRMLRLQQLLAVAGDQPLGDGTARTARDVLRAAYQALDDAVGPIYEQGLGRLGREMLPPFTQTDLAVVMNAVAEGLRLRADAHPSSVRAGLYADTVTALLIGITRPRVERRETARPLELSTLESRLAVHRPPRSTPDAPLETWRHIADAAAHLFDERPASEVRVAEVAAAAGVSTSTVHHHFGCVSAVAAAGFVRHLPELEAVAREPLTAEEGPILRIEQVLRCYVGLVREHRGAAEAVVAEVIAECRPGGDPSRPRSIRDLVPVPDLVVDLIRELRVRGVLRRRVDGDRLARSLIHLVTMRVLLFDDESVDRIVDETMTLVFDGALVAPSDT